MIRFSANRIWQNWQNVDANLSAKEETLHKGFREYPPAFPECLPTKEDLAKMQAWSDNLKSQNIETLIICGIGGSALGAKAITSLVDPFTPKLFFWEGPHPQLLQYLGRLAEQRKTALLFISKSGTTLETRTNYALYRQFFPSAPLYYVTSEPEKIEDLVVTKEHVFLIPKPLGGRYSVISPVGLLPAYFLGVDVDSLVAGFKAGLEAWDISIPLAQNGAKIVANEYYELFQANFTGAVFWIYAHDLKGWGAWLIQLWAESLGKKTEVHATPILNLGPEDQHSVLQYYMQGPNHFIHTFIHTNSYGRHDTVVPAEYAVESANQSLWKVLHSQMQSIEIALTEQNRPVAEFVLPELTIYQLGKWFAFWMYVVTYLGYLWELNPFDQPGVESGKIYCKKLLSGVSLKLPTTELLEF
ncbi:MAG: hypothetical protein NZM25_06610 [Leptospiraceae bacterium]|nr:hypothetical protein [Leptospiraceae bacterium]MDW8306553.1 hypothetical protein [Leptospiraceae bacterium]